LQRRGVCGDYRPGATEQHGEAEMYPVQRGTRGSLFWELLEELFLGSLSILAGTTLCGAWSSLQGLCNSLPGWLPMVLLLVSVLLRVPGPSAQLPMPGNGSKFSD